jgi:hypothetical protein
LSDAGPPGEEEQDGVEGRVEERCKGAGHDQLERDDEVQQDHATEERTRLTHGFRVCHRAFRL